MSVSSYVGRYKNEVNNLWYEENCLNDENLEYIKNVLLKPFKMVNGVKEQTDAYNETALIIRYQLHSYKIEVDKESSCLILWKRKQSVNPNAKKFNPKEKELYTLIDKAGEDGCFKSMDAWVDVINWIAKKEIEDGVDL